MKSIMTTLLVGACFMAMGQKDRVYPVAEEMPVLQACAEKYDMQQRYQCQKDQIAAHVAANLKYPAEAKMAGAEGYVTVRFVVSSTGKMTHLTVAEDPGNGMAAAAIKAVKKLNGQWVAGKIKGEAVNVKMSVPVRFKLPEKKTETQSAPDVYSVVDEMPRFAGCEDKPAGEARNCTFKAVTKFVMANMQYPEEAKGYGVEGTVVTRFVIDELGKVTKARIVEGLGRGCDEEALRLLAAMPTWTPGKHKGAVVKVQMKLPFRFTTKKGTE